MSCKNCRTTGTCSECSRRDAQAARDKLAVLTAERDRLREALGAIAKPGGGGYCDTCLRILSECNGSHPSDNCPGKIARKALETP